MLLKKLYLIALILGWLVGCVIVICTSVGHTPFQLKSSDKIKAFQMLPQGWGFFTRDPREDKLFVYKISGDELYKITQPNFSADNLFGLSRLGRMTQMQASNLILQNFSKFQDCDKKDPMECLTDSIYRFENSFKNKLLRGKYLIKKEPALPWAWSRNRRDKSDPYQILMVEVY